MVGPASSMSPVLSGPVVHSTFWQMGVLPWPTRRLPDPFRCGPGLAPLPSAARPSLARRCRLPRPQARSQRARCFRKAIWRCFPAFISGFPGLCLQKGICRLRLAATSAMTVWRQTETFCCLRQMVSSASINARPPGATSGSGSKMPTFPITGADLPHPARSTSMPIILISPTAR
ncbi:hypothetical protein D3C87_887650 [compost metagenome]